MWSKYEAEKRRLQTMNLPPTEYEKRIQEIVRKLENGKDNFCSSRYLYQPGSTE